MVVAEDSHFPEYTFLSFEDYRYFYTDVKCVYAEKDDYRSKSNKSVPAEEKFLSIPKSYYRIFAFRAGLFVKSVFQSSLYVSFLRVYPRKCFSIELDLGICDPFHSQNRISHFACRHLLALECSLGEMLNLRRRWRNVDVLTISLGTLPRLLWKTRSIYKLDGGYRVLQFGEVLFFSIRIIFSWNWRTFP